MVKRFSRIVFCPIILVISLLPVSVYAASLLPGDTLTIGSVTVEVGIGEAVQTDPPPPSSQPVFSMDSTGTDLVNFGTFTISPTTADTGDKPALFFSVIDPGAGSDTPIAGFTSFITNSGGSGFLKSILTSDEYLGSLVSGSTVYALFSNLAPSSTIVGLPNYGGYVILEFVTRDGTSLVGAIDSTDVISATLFGADEVGQVPLPASGWLMLAAIGAGGALRMRRRTAGRDLTVMS